MKIRKLLILLLALTFAVLAVGCEREDGNTSGSAESNGVISDESREHSQKPEQSRDASEDISHAVSQGEQDISDVLSDVESGAGDLISDAEGAVSDLVDGQ